MRGSTLDPRMGSGGVQNRRPMPALEVRSRWIGRREGGAAAMEEGKAIEERTREEGAEAAVPLAVLLAVFLAVLDAALRAVVAGDVDDVRSRSEWEW